MTVFFMGGELDSFTPFEPSTIEVTVAGTFNPVYARCSISIGPNSNTDPNAGFITPAFGPVSEIYYHFDINSNADTQIALRPTFLLVNTSGNFVAGIGNANTGSTRQFGYYDNNIFVPVGDTFTLPNNTLVTIDGYYNTSTREYWVKRNGIIVASGVHPPATVPPLLNISQLRFRPNNANNNGTRISQVFATDFDTTNYNLYTKPPTANGANTAWTGSFADVDEVVTNDLDFISSNIVDQIETFTGAAIAIPSGTIAAVSVNARVTANAGGPQSVRGVLRIGGTNYFSANTDTLGTGWRAYEAIFEINPATGLPFTISEASAASLEFGLQSRT